MGVFFFFLTPEKSCQRCAVIIIAKTISQHCAIIINAKASAGQMELNNSCCTKIIVLVFKQSQSRVALNNTELLLLLK